MAKQYRCLHCNNKLVNHQLDKINELIYFVILKMFFFHKFANFKIFNKFLDHWVLQYYFRVLLVLKVIKIDDKFDRKKIINRALVLIDEAANQQIKIRPLINYKNEYFNNYYLNFQDYNTFFEGLPINLGGKKINFDLIDDKYKLKMFLKSKQLPYAKGKSFFTKSRGLKYGLKLGFPLVVKPRDGSLSNHVSVDIRSVEKFIPGTVHRLTGIGKNVFAVQRIPATIIGDSQLMVCELIALKNQHEFRGEAERQDCTLHKIEIDDITLKLLANQGLNLDSILDHGQAAILKEKVNLGSGCDIIEVTEEMHPATKLMALELAKLLNTDILGIDFICKNIKQSWQEQDC
ncbi:MAG: hypothetical protein NTX00_02265, partial [Candidatus Parcubacteria bacterium]|nr:hypothetical protein [Candidatus Parcubacteria bacterium]